MTIIAGMLPWTLLVVFALFRIRHLHLRKLSNIELFALIAALTVIVFYCIPHSKRSVYLLPAYPFMAYGIACLIQNIRFTMPSLIYGWIIGFIGVLAPLYLLVESWTEIMPDDIMVKGFIGYFMLIVTIIVSSLWLFFGARRALGRNLVIYMLYLTYSAAIMPALFRIPLKTAHATDLFNMIKNNDVDVRTVANGRFADQVYWFNFYLEDRIRRVSSVDEAVETLEPGSVLILPLSVDPEPLRQSGHWTLFLLPYNPDTRAPVTFAIKR